MPSNRSRARVPERDGEAGRDATPPRLSVILDGGAEPSFSKARYAYTVLRGRILDGVHRPGEWLRLSQIAASLKLSEMPVREAMRLLEKDGLVVIHLHRGAQVASLSFERALQVTEARMVLECHAALAAAPLHDRASLSAARRIVDAMESVREDLVAFGVKNRAFATALYARCPNGFLAQHIQDLWDQCWQYSSVAVFEVMRHRVQGSIDENRAICDGIAGRDEAAVRAAYDERLRRSLEAWRGAIAAQQRAGAEAAAADRAPG